MSARPGHGGALARVGLALVLLGGGRASLAEDGADAEAAAPAPEDDPLGTAEQDTWPMQDGCPARTRATRTRPLVGPLVDAWTFQAPGRIAGDPRVWREWVVVECEAEHGRTLDVLRLSDGKPVIPRRKFEKASALDPVLWNDLVCLHPYPGLSEVLRVSVQNQVLEGTPGEVRDDAQFFLGGGDFLCAGRDTEAVVVGNGLADRPTLVLSRRHVGREKPLWSWQTSGSLVGRVSARHGRVYALVFVPETGYATPRARLVSMDLVTGNRPKEVDLGWFAVKEPKDGAVCVAAQELFAFHPDGILIKEDRHANAVRVGLDANGEPGTPFLLDDAQFPAVAWGSKTYPAITEKGGVVLVESPSRPSAPDADPGVWLRTPLARGADDPGLLPGPRPPVVARGTAFFTNATIDLPHRRVLDLRPSSAELVIPARETMLFVEAAGRKLVARRAARPDLRSAPGPRLSEDPADPRLDVPGATAVSYDGAVRMGRASWSPKDRRLTGLGRDAPALADLGLLLDKDGRVLHGPDAGFTARALPWAVAQKLRADWTALGKKASSTQDLPTLRTLAADLVARGAKTEEILPLEKEIARLETPSPIPRPPVKERVAEVAARRKDLVAAETAGLWAAFTTLPDTVLYAYRVDLLRGILEADPDDPRAVAWVRGELPAGLALKGTIPPLEWLEVLEAAWKANLRLVADKTAPPMNDDERVLAAAKLSWRPDLVGLRTGRLLLITPVARPGRIARCLSLGEVVCSALDGLFDLKGEAAASAEPLVIHLYESQREYLAQSPAAHRDGDSHLQMEYTLGHYSPAEGVSRLYVPEGREAFESVMDTLAHELTHHWVDRRMPPAPEEKRRASGGGDAAGYFLEEGFAMMVEEFLFDLRARSWTTFDPHARSLDAVARAKDLLPWDRVYSLVYRDFVHLGHDPAALVSLRWSLGAMRWSESNFFYAQAAATCHWLFEAEGGKNRPVLLRLLQDLHGRGIENGALVKRLHLPPEALGAQVLAWSREVTAAPK